MKTSTFSVNTATLKCQINKFVQRSIEGFCLGVFTKNGIVSMTTKVTSEIDHEPVFVFVEEFQTVRKRLRTKLKHLKFGEMKNEEVVEIYLRVKRNRNILIEELASKGVKNNNAVNIWIRNFRYRWKVCHGKMKFFEKYRDWLDEDFTVIFISFYCSSNLLKYNYSLLSIT